MPTDFQQFAKNIYAIVATIPKGKVATYGQLALLAGCPQNSRLAGRAMRLSSKSLKGTHRVVSSAGRLVQGWAKQQVLLEAENVFFKENGCVNMKKCLWQPFSPD